jgi:nucleotide-binding universal stress UspA family protein
MSTVVAALDASAAARPVLESALRMAELTGADVEAVHVGSTTDGLVAELARRFDLPLRLLAGPVEAALLQRLNAPDVVVAVIGARGATGGRQPAGHAATELMQRARCPVLVVPPDLACPQPSRWRRLLMPLEGTAESSQAAAEALDALITGEIETIVLHVFTPATAPPMLDRPSRDLELWADEFLARHGPPTARIECRTGSAADQIARVCDAEHADLVALSWSQNMSPGHAAVIRDVLGRSTIPVLLLPTAR